MCTCDLPGYVQADPVRQATSGLTCTPKTCENTGCGGDANATCVDLAIGVRCGCAGGFFESSKNEANVTCREQTCANVDGVGTSAECGDGAVCSEGGEKDGFKCACDQSAFQEDSRWNEPAVCVPIVGSVPSPAPSSAAAAAAAAASGSSSGSSSSVDNGGSHLRPENRSGSGGKQINATTTSAGGTDDDADNSAVVVTVAITSVVAVFGIVGGALVYRRIQNQKAQKRLDREKVAKRIEQWAISDRMPGTDIVNPVATVGQVCLAVEMSEGVGASGDEISANPMQKQKQRDKVKKKRRLSAAAVKSHRASFSKQQEGGGEGQQQQQQLQDEKAGLPPRDLRLPRRKSVIELGRIRDRIAAAFGSESGEQNQAALWELRKRYGIDIAAHRGEWVEAHDSATGRTVYYHVPTRRVQKAMPRGWVGMVVRDING